MADVENLCPVCQARMILAEKEENQCSLVKAVR